MIYKIPIHSVIDVITNSSTEIYVTTTEKAAEFAKELINDIFKLAKIKGTFDEYFDIEYINNIWDLEDLLARELQYGSEELINLFNEAESEVANDPEKEGDYWRISSALIEYWEDIIPVRISDYLVDRSTDENKIRRYLIISSKDETIKEIVHLSEHFNKIFEAYENYQG